MERVKDCLLNLDRDRKERENRLEIAAKVKEAIENDRKYLDVEVRK